MDSSITAIFLNLVSLIPPLFVFIACCFYLSKQTKTDSVLLFIGSGVSLLLTGFYSLLMPYLMQSSALPVSEASFYYSITGVISFISGVCFAVGLYILINNTINNNKINYTQFPKSND